MDEVNEEIVHQRLERYLGDHQVNLYNTVVGLALGAAGVTAASLIARRGIASHDLGLVWALWVLSAMALGVAFSGLMANEFALPIRVPRLPDLVLPLLIGVSEFMLFGVLSPIVSATDGRRKLVIWLVAFSIFSTAASLSLLRGRWLLAHGRYEAAIAPAVATLRGRLISDVIGSAGSTVITVTSALIFGVGRTSLVFAWIPVGLLAVAMTVGFRSQSTAIREFQSGLGL